MKQLWLVLGFLALMFLIGHGWQGDTLRTGLPGSKGPSTTGTAAATTP